MSTRPGSTRSRFAERPAGFAHEPPHVSSRPGGVGGNDLYAATRANQPDRGCAAWLYFAAGTFSAASLASMSSAEVAGFTALSMAAMSPCLSM